MSRRVGLQNLVLSYHWLFDEVPELEGVAEGEEGAEEEPLEELVSEPGGIDTSR